MVANMSAQQALVRDLASSGLTFADLGAREVTPPELAATNSPTMNVNGFVIPYYGLDGKALPFYRVKLLNVEPKYKQPKGTPNHVYYPRHFLNCLHNLRAHANGCPPFIVVTEGEKKAACAVKNGFPTVGLGGVDSWRNRTLVLPGDVKLTAKTSGKNKTIQAQLQNTKDSLNIEEDISLAEGLYDLIDLSIREGLYIVIIFDTDVLTGGLLKPDVQRAAAMLGYKLRHEGVPLDHIKQVILPAAEKPGQKMGLDDFLMEYSADDLFDMIENSINSRESFPRHPNPRAYINHLLNKGRISRDECQEIALAILTELDARGRRLWAEGLEAPYFFDETTYKLMPAAMLSKTNEPLHESPFGRYLYQEFGLSGGDSRVLGWLASQFTGEKPVDDVEPQRIIAIPPDNPDNIALQISDSEFALVTPDPKSPVRVLTNGSEGLLFEQDQVEPISPQELMQTIGEMRNQTGTYQPWWVDVLKTTKIIGPNVHEICALLYYLSPWLYRWRNIQLPIEVLHGEPNSGKSSLLGLRLQILSGRPELRNVPTDIKDWYASVANAGGLFVVDNVQFTDRNLRQRLSDELCRIVTAPAPFIEMRKLYTTTGQARVPVQCTFAFTAIQQPFNNPDIIQRSAIFQMEAHESMNNAWVGAQLSRFGGRTRWVAHHLLVLHKFLNRACQPGVWKPGQEVSHRLAYYEQSLNIMCDVLQINKDHHLPVGWLAETLVGQTRKELEEADWTIKGLKSFLEEMGYDQPKKGNIMWSRFTATEIVDWAQLHDEFQKNVTLSNARKLGRYMQSHKVIIKGSTGITEYGIAGNKQVYTYYPIKK